MLIPASFADQVLPTFDSPKVAKARLPSWFLGVVTLASMGFFVRTGDFLNDRLVTFSTAARLAFIRKW